MPGQYIGIRDKPASERKFRLPSYASLSGILSTELKADPQALKQSVEVLLTRMRQEGRLNTSDLIPDILARLFPASGGVDLAEFDRIVSPADRRQVYQDARDAATTIKPPDRRKFKAALRKSIHVSRTSSKDHLNLAQVFGWRKVRQAAQIYGGIVSVLQRIQSDLDSHVSTDYNLDTNEIGLGGWADYSTMHMRLEPGVVKANDPSEAAMTIIHEAAHLADPSVDDSVYYGVEGYTTASESVKIANAAHFEEVPRRKLNISAYRGQHFIPGKQSGGQKMTREDEVLAEASNLLRKAWDKSVDVFLWLRDIHVECLNLGTRAAYVANEPKVLAFSNMLELTIHKQDPAIRTITAVDLTLAEGVPRSFSRSDLAVDLVPTFMFPSLAAQLKSDTADDAWAFDLARRAVKRIGGILSNEAADLSLMQFMIREYRKDI
jgi:hypothetical protein